MKAVAQAKFQFLNVTVNNAETKVIKTAQMPGFYIDIFQKRMGEYTPNIFPSKNVWSFLCHIFQCFNFFYNLMLT